MMLAGDRGDPDMRSVDLERNSFARPFIGILGRLTTMYLGLPFGLHTLLLKTFCRPHCIPPA